jgi:Fe-S-cluster-containing dehydrogenase component|tara:strand:+ start:22 stop:1443 length:1422 start_codon:yes stop_codon:yes gene_type:complete
MVNYGFVIDNRKCIGCHACTVACKSEHEVPIGVNRTHVKYIETGEYPNNSREFSVHRCNHCEDSPCTTICPTIALFTREDGIVDFDDERCIGCKSCMQACPYDALYIDPNKGTAAKCNYCAHRIEESYEPACVIVCPTEAIISGDLDEENSSISNYILENDVSVRKPESGAKPNLFYIDASPEMLDPLATERTQSYVWSEQAAGVGHYAKYAEERISNANTNSMIVQLALEKKAKSSNPRDRAIIRDVMERLDKDTEMNAKRTYDQPSKGILWGWEVSAYIWTKAISAGLYMVAMIGWLLFDYDLNEYGLLWPVIGISLIFLAITGILLVMDLDRPERFLYVMLRPNWDSWLVKGAYVLSLFGGILILNLVIIIFNLDIIYLKLLAVIGIPVSILTGVYTAWLLQQAKGRSWSKDKLLPFRFLIDTLIIGIASLLLISNYDEILYALISIGVLVFYWHEGKRMIIKPQMESLT